MSTTKISFHIQPSSTPTEIFDFIIENQLQIISYENLTHTINIISYIPNHLLNDFENKYSFLSITHL